jgi:hypothetical protein
MSNIHLVTRGDDAGSSHSANHAIRQCIEGGLLKNTSIMTPGPAFEEAAELLRDLRGADLGLHVVLNSEWDFPRWGPVAPREQVPTLLDADGNFTQTPTDLDHRKASVAEMMIEVQAQLDKSRAAGLDIRYLDQHMGVGWVRGLGDQLKELCQRESLIFADVLPGLPPLEQPLDNAIDDLIARLRAAPEGTYVYVTHPTYDDEETRAITGMGNRPGQIARDRDVDRRLWLDEGVRDACAEFDVEVVRYSQVF